MGTALVVTCSRVGNELALASFYVVSMVNELPGTSCFTNGFLCYIFFICLRMAIKNIASPKSLSTAYIGRWQILYRTRIYVIEMKILKTYMGNN